jgi:hypothetical protein
MRIIFMLTIIFINLLSQLHFAEASTSSQSSPTEQVTTQDSSMIKMSDLEKRIILLEKQQKPWYYEPAWYALFISIVALLVSILRHRREERKTRSEIQRNLTQQAVSINEAFVRLDVKGPYAHHLNIPDDKVKVFTSKAVMLLNQLNLLRDIHQHCEILGDEELEIYGKWASTILRPWIEADEDLKRVWFLSKEAEDLRHPDFSKWLNNILPIIKT